MNIIENLTKMQMSDSAKAAQIKELILSLFKSNDVSVAEARDICERVLSSMELSPLK